MTDKQRKFADEYLIDCNATRAYKAAYPSIKSEEAARANASRLLTYDNVKKYIAERMEEVSNSKIATAEEVMEYLTKVLRGESQSEIVIVESVSQGVSEARNMMKAPDEKEKLKAAELLGKRFGLYTDKLSVDAAIPVVIAGSDKLED